MELQLAPVHAWHSEQLWGRGSSHFAGVLSLAPRDSRQAEGNQERAADMISLSSTLVVALPQVNLSTERFFTTWTALSMRVQLCAAEQQVPALDPAAVGGPDGAAAADLLLLDLNLLGVKQSLHIVLDSCAGITWAKSCTHRGLQGSIYDRFSGDFPDFHQYSWDSNWAQKVE